MPLFLVYAACAFASGFALRLVDPIVLPVAAHFSVTPAASALLNSAYALPYALSQPFLGPIGDRFGKARCIKVCIAGLALMLAAGALATTFSLLLVTRVVGGVFAGGLIPLVIAGLGDSYAMTERQVMLGRMLLAIISGQMLGSVVSGLANVAFGWHSALVIASAIGVLAAVVAWTAMPASTAHDDAPHASFAALYGRVFANPKAPWLYGAVLFEGVLFYGFFPFMSEMLLATTGQTAQTISVETGLVLGAFGIGGLLYAASVRRLLRLFGVRRLCLIGSAGAALCFAALAFSPLWWLDAAAMFGAGVAFYMLHNSLQTEATELAPTARGSAVALFACGFFFGQGLGPLVFGGLLHTLGPRPALIAVAATIVVLGRVVVARVIDRRLPAVA